MKKESDNNFLFATGVASVISSMASKFLVHPMDTLKAKVQIESEKSSLMHGQLRRVLKETIQQQGIKGLYSGMSVATLGLIPAMSLFFVSYEASKERLLNNHYLSDKPSVVYFMSGMIAEGVSCVFFVPIDIIKERLQVMHSLKTYHYQSTSHAFKQIISTEGITGLYRAYGATLASFGPFSAAHMTIYETLKKKCCHDPREVSFGEALLLSATSGSIASVLTNPLDIAKMRMQVQRGAKAAGPTVKGDFGYSNMFHGIYTIYYKEGFLSLYKGTLARVLYHCPNVAIIMSLIETIRPSILNNLSH